jgi:hypothetical protein
VTFIRFSFLITGFLVLSTAAAAGEIASDTSIGSGIFTERVGYSGSGAEASSPWSYDASYSFSASEVGAARKNAGGTGQVDHTHTIDFGIGYEGDHSQGGSLSYSRTPEELLTVLGAGLYFGHRYSIGSQDDHFEPSLKITLSGDLSHYTQKFSKSSLVGRKQRPGAGSEGIVQSSIGLSGTWKPLEWLGFRLSGTRYFYDKDVSQFIAQLDQARAISTRISNFTNTLSGFSREELNLGTDFELPESFGLIIDYTLAHAQVSGLGTSGYSVKANHSWGAFDTGLSYSYSSSESDAQGLLGISAAYRF